jgi:hypothetical protein
MDLVEWINRILFDIIHHSCAQEEYVHNGLPNILNIDAGTLDSNASHFFLCGVSVGTIPALMTLL